MESVAPARIQPTNRTMGKSNVLSTPGDGLRGEVTSVETKSEKPQLPPGFTLRVKPDRRCVQLPIPAGFDRRRSR